MENWELRFSVSVRGASARHSDFRESCCRQGSGDSNNLRGVAFRRCSSEVADASAAEASGSCRLRVARRAELARFEGFCDSLRGESRCGFGRGEKHRNDGHSQRRFGGGANGCPVASRQVVFGFGRGVQRSQASVGGGGGMCEMCSSGCMGNADTEQVVTTRGPRP